jgi:acylphosphatase
MSDRCVHVIITGRVQGVGFRAWVADQAQRLKINGWVRNRSNGSVEALFSGESHKVEHMLGLCDSGPNTAQVDEIVIIAEDEKSLPHFEVLETM